MQAYKVLHPDKAQGAIFGPEANVEKSEGKKDLDIMEINEIHKKEEKNLQYCQICAGKGFKNKAKMHNTVDCYDKPGNKDNLIMKHSKSEYFYFMRSQHSSNPSIDLFSVGGLILFSKSIWQYLSFYFD